ncbi:hypothetical protein IQ224_00280 [Microcystis sp. LEGE 00066]|uniref:Glycosyltransferase RgtA/B/C/D-like domain-containing protein n=2 Tax=Microcystis aeruginosa (strain PCC 7806) TaxID=267872 RepID=A0AB33BYP4_MICA7|nr:MULTISPECIES: hypothetical protein [Microcystis]TRT96561.1 MAG: hypothetical protein EWV61_20415 [Microcystis aeruginosa Ma_AC_P_19900807_S300]ARI82465.1 hypothetical protein BH695_3186 [Microcystis aeruginosa PCC 7806SL]ELS45214.1 hypothetical protein C789_4978 [Microcystis aeruginosa FACHB-905 = DIANCHI905]MBE9260727.1 hypothetical protein [Microcystis sp. LEGE 00066]UGS10652.1 hypothetical protein LRR78_08565 [Microcystis aeruginosa FACHB-905 = DIANCHI905]
MQKLINFRPKDRMQLTAVVLIILAIAFAFFTRIITAFEYVTFDIGPEPDQIVIGNTVINMWQGKIPALGMAGSGGKYPFTIPPLYFYLVFPFTIFGSDPAFLVLANGVFSFLAIPLLIYLVYQLLEKVEFSKRILLSSLAGFWYSTFYTDYFISNFSWNPSPIPFFLIIFVLLYKFQLETKQSSYYQAISWIVYGVILAILVSLHSTTMFVLPVVCVLTSLWFVYKNRKNFLKCLLPFLAIISSNIALLHYWKVEIARNFSNTKAIINAIIGSDETTTQSGNLLARLFKAIWEFVFLGNQVYFISKDWLWFNLFLSVFFCVISLYFTLRKFQGNKTILAVLALTWLIFMYAASNYQEEYFFSHRKILIWFAPMLMGIISLAYLNFNNKWPRFFGIILIGLIGYSIATNLYFDQRYISSKYSTERLLSASDIIDIFNQIPPRSNICYPAKKGKRKINNQYDYIDNHITKRNLQVVNSCQTGDYILQSKFKMDLEMNDLFPIFSLTKTPSLEQKANLVLETPEAYLYKLN